MNSETARGGVGEGENMTNEEFYDKEIAPKLMSLGELCQERGMSFSCFVEYAPDNYAETSCVKAEASVSFRMILWAAAARGNLDSFVIAAQRYAQKSGHRSMVLRMLETRTSHPE